MKIEKALKIFVFFSLMISFYQKGLGNGIVLMNSVFYVSAKGNDTEKGNIAHPFKTIERLNREKIKSGDTIYFEGGASFTGRLLIDQVRSDKNHYTIISSYGKGKAVLDGGNGEAIAINKSAFIKIKNLALKGSGRKNGNTKNGLSILYADHVEVSSVTVSGFQKSGIFIYSSSYIRLQNCMASENGMAGIELNGEYGKKETKNIQIRNCTAFNNPGDPTNLTNHSGNGILAGNCANVLIDHCTAYNNGWDMPRTGNGPVGIWAYEADRVVIQYCISHHNKTSKGGEDGGGFDLDGGVTHSIIQYCDSYENEGPGFGIFQYSGASPWYNNTIRFCSSTDDGLVSRSHANVFVWNQSEDASQFKNLFFHHNKLINTKGVAIRFDITSKHEGFQFYQNQISAKDTLLDIRELNEKDIFRYNVWKVPGKRIQNIDSNIMQNDLAAIRDDKGNRINAHGAGILFHEGIYYLYGEYKAGATRLVPNQSWEDYRVPAGGIACYSSADLKNWHYQGVVLKPTKGNNESDIDTGRVIERPKVLYNSKTKKFVIWMHIDKNDYSYARVGIAVSDKATGPFVFVKSFRPNGQESRDMTLFKDTDNKAYLFYSSENNNTMHVTELAEDYLQVKEKFNRILVDQRRESPAVFMDAGKYYLITSLCTGWLPNKALYTVADNPMNSWTMMDNPCKGSYAEITHGSQISFVQPIRYKKGKYIVLADLWNKTDLPSSNYLWMPLIFKDGKPNIHVATVY